MKTQDKNKLLKIIEHHIVDITQFQITSRIKNSNMDRDSRIDNKIAFYVLMCC